MKQEEGNRLIASFMGATFKKTNDSVLVKCDTLFAGRLDYCLLHKLEYHCSWDWLMPVVKKINNTNKFDVIIWKYDCHINDKEKIIFENGDKKVIKAVWKTVVQFITWYNSITNKNK